MVRNEETQDFRPETYYIRCGDYAEAQASSSFLEVLCLQELMV